MKQINDKLIDFIICDLPYGVTHCYWDKALDINLLWEHYKRLISDCGVIALTARQPFASQLIMDNLEMFKYEWIWVKDKPFNFLHAKNSPMSIHESVLIFSKAKIKHDGQPDRMPYYPQELKPYNKPIRDRKKTRNDTTGHNIYRPSFNKGAIQEYTNYPMSVLYIPSVNNGILHPTQKPVELFEYMIKTYTNKGQLVLDNCAGSGTAGVACKNLKRNYILIEKEDEYIEIIKKRLNGERVENKKLQQQEFDFCI
jgi:site-specific DNA-methyltransferase (adenine-specific)